MFVITGRVLTIHKLSDKASQIVLKKTVKGKMTPIAIDVFGFWKDKMEEMKLSKNDKIKGTVYVKSNLYKNKWYTDLYFKEIEWVQTKAKPSKNGYRYSEDDIIGDNKRLYDENGNFLF